MNKKGVQAALEASVLIFLIGLFILGYIILLPEADRNEILGETDSVGSDGDEAGITETLLSEAPGEVQSSSGSVNVYTLEPMRLYSTTDSVTDLLASTLTVSRNVLHNNYKNIYFDVENADDLESLSLLFLITDAKGEMVIELNGNLVYEGEITSNDLPLSLPTSSLQEHENVLKLSTSSVGWNIFSAHEYKLQDVQLIKDYTLADTTSTRTFSVDDPGQVTSVDLSYFITCNRDEAGVLSISLNSREVFSDSIFCEYLTERELSLNEDYLQTTNTLRFEVTEGDYNIEEVEIEVKEEGDDFPTFNFDIDLDLFEEIEAGDKEVYLKLSFGDDSSEKTASILVNEHSFRFSTEDGEYEAEITSLLDHGVNSVSLDAETNFEVDNLKVYVTNT